MNEVRDQFAQRGKDLVGIDQAQTFLQAVGVVHTQGHQGGDAGVRLAVHRMEGFEQLCA